MDPYDPFNNNSVEVEDFIVGRDECKVAYATPKCNGKLKPGTIYRIKVLEIIQNLTVFDKVQIFWIVHDP